MKHLSRNLIQRMLLAASTMVVINIVWAWVFVQFVHYHAQSQALSPEDVVVDVASKAELAQLADPKVREVTFADGRKLIKSEAWDELKMADYYAPATDGTTFVKVTSKGTATFARQWTQSTVLLLIFAIPAMFLSAWNLKLDDRSAASPAAK